MQKSDKATALKEWREIMKKHPDFARVVLAQQAVLIEASQWGNRIVEDRMCKLVQAGLVFPFLEYWQERCKKAPPVDVGGVIGCIMTAKNPASCFSLRGEDEWFDDPLAGGKVVPPRPPVPPLKGTSKGAR